MPKKKKTKKRVVKPLQYKTKSGRVLTPKQTKFCKLYVEYMGNGTKAAMGAYDCIYATANSLAPENLVKPSIIECIRELLEESAVNEASADAALGFALNQFKDIGSKLKAVDIFNKMKGRYAKKEVDLNVRTYEDLVDETGI